MSEDQETEAAGATGPSEDAATAPSAAGDDEGHVAHGMAGEGGHGDDHHDAHTEESIGSIDWPIWGAAVLGVGIAVFMAVLMALVVGMI